LSWRREEVESLKPVPERLRPRLEAAWLRYELLSRDIGDLVAKRQAIEAEISELTRSALEELGLECDPHRVRPRFEGYRLVGLLVPEDVADKRGDGAGSKAEGEGKAKS